MSENEMTLTKWRLGALRVLPGFTATATDLMTDEYIDGVLLELRGYIMAQHVGNVAYPADWWQAFKLRWLPEWVLRRWPPRFISIDVAAVFPEYAPPPLDLVGPPAYVRVNINPPA